MTVRSSLAAIAAIATLLTLALSAGASANDAWGPGYRSCGSFKAEYRINVSAKGVRCSIATRVQREYWLAPKRRKVIVRGGVGADGYVLLKRFPGWKCFSGAGAGSCVKGSKHAAYDN
jgi:hypothetical protein